MVLINVMVRYNASKQKIESFGNGRYLIYLCCGESEGEEMLIGILSKYLGTPVNRILFKHNTIRGAKIFEII
jgi:hypothetical protein